MTADITGKQTSTNNNDLSKNSFSDSGKLA